MAISVSSTVCSICAKPLKQEGECLACLLRGGLDEKEEEQLSQNSLVFGDFEIERRDDGSFWELGRGAMGVTYRARDRMLHRDVALKVIDVPAKADNACAARERFLREARAAAALRHHNVASVFQIGAPNDTERCYYAMELIEGETLATLVRRDGPLPVTAALDMAIQVARALLAAAAHGLIHRDLKPANIMLAPNEAQPNTLEAKVIDFGLAKAAAEAADQMDITHGQFVGTPAFASPEQFNGKAADARSDIYSLGVTLWYALTGEVPYPGKTIEQIRVFQQEVALPVEQLKAHQVPAPLIKLLQRALAIDPIERPGSARVLLDDLEVCRAALRTAPRRRRQTIAALLCALGLLGLTKFLIQRHAPGDNAPAKSVAVLPFENLNKDKENALFTDGVHEQVLTDIAMVADLKVIGRTSVMQYKKVPRGNPREIARQLGVAHLVEGSVQRAGDKVRISAQLINAASETPEWAQTYDRPVNEVFAIQSEIASAVANQLQAKMSYNEKAAMLAAPTTDLVASALYQQALALQEKFPYHTSELESVRLLDEAVARDPNFIRAYYLLGQVHIILYTGGYDHTSARRELARAAIQNAARLQPEAGELHLAWARYAYYCTNDYDRAEAELDLARRTLPNDAEVYFTSAVLDRVQGRWDEAIKNAKRSVELDPRNRQHVLLAAGAYSCLRRYSEAQPFLDLALELPPKDYYNRISYVELPFEARADIQPMRKELSAILEEDAGAEAKIADELFHCALLERDPLAAARAVAAIPADRLHPREWYAGLADRTFNNPVAAHNSFNAARPLVEKIVLGQSDYAQAWSLLGKIDAALGRREDAIREGRHGCELLPISKNALRGADLITGLATIYAWVGEKDLALEQLTLSARVPGGVSYGELKLDPQWDSLRGDPRFEKIVASLAPPDSKK